MTMQQALDTKIKQFVLLMINAQRSLRLYPAYNPIPMSAIERAYATLVEIFQQEPELTLKFTKTACLHRGEALPASASEAAKISAFANEIFEKGISSVTFFDKTKKEDLTFFLSLMAKDASEIADTGGVSAALKASDVDQIMVSEIPRKVSFSESGEARDIASAGFSEEQRLFDLLESILTKDTHTDKESSLLMHLVSRPQDLRAVMKYLSSKGVEKGAVNIRLLEKVVTTLRAFIERRTGLLDGLEQNLTQAILTIDESVSDALIVDLIFAAVRNPTARNLVSELPAEAVSSAILRAAEGGTTPIERVAPALGKIDVDPSTKNAIIELLKAGLSRKGYQQEELDILFKEEEEREVTEAAAQELLEGREQEGGDGPRGVAAALPSIPVEETILDSRDAKLLEILRSEASTLRADDHVAFCLLELMRYSTSEESLHEARRLLFQIMPQIASDRDFHVLARIVDWAKATLQSPGPETIKVVAREILRELTIRKYILQAFEAMAAPDATPTVSNRAMGYLKVLDRDEVIKTLIEILGTEEMLSRRKILISMIATLSEDNIDLLGKRIDDPKWYLVRNIVTIFAMTGRKEAIPYLAQTIKHADFRVRKESVKALGIIGGPEAFEVLLEALKEDSSDIKGLIIRSLGQTRDERALDILDPIVRERDFLWRNASLKVAAIDALGRIRNATAIELLKQAARARSLFFPRRARQVAEAAKAALASVTDHDVPDEEDES